ncbi:MAG: hypothetical protein MUF43_13675 [Flavobacterium sp.]|jgi:hypothetical protein|nr:hypothetical protein [Flavobacterium sp.]
MHFFALYLEDDDEKTILTVFDIIEELSIAEIKSEQILETFLQKFELNEITYPFLMYCLHYNIDNLILSEAHNPYDNLGILKNTNGYVLFFNQLCDILVNYANGFDKDTAIHFTKELNKKSTHAIQTLKELKLKNSEIRLIDAFEFFKTPKVLYHRYWFDIPSQILNISYYV